MGYRPRPRFVFEEIFSGSKKKNSDQWNNIKAITFNYEYPSVPTDFKTKLGVLEICVIQKGKKCPCIKSEKYLSL